MLLNKSHSCLLLIDVQEKLTPLVLSADALVERCHWLIRLAKDLQVPWMLCEQYPHGLGKTLESLRSWVTNEMCFEKVHFSCYHAPGFLNHYESLQRPQILLMGIETHVCVLQTALDCVAADMDVYVIVDAVSSRSASDQDIALRRMQQAGVKLITSEMVFFEWLRQAGSEEFRLLSRKFFKS